jgi:UDP-hydrolysing UDP-N-acetyl-D-glucosamine 2-epimerase
MKKICLVITARGNYAKLKSLIKILDKSNFFEVQIILGGSIVLEKYGKILELDNTISHLVKKHIFFLIEGETPLTMAKSGGVALTEFSSAFDELNPDLVVIIADRFECLPIAIAATYMNILVAHIEGGEISGSIDESIRHAITKLSHIHFPASNEAYDRIVRMGEDPNKIFKVGSTSFDAISNLNIESLVGVSEYLSENGLGNVDLMKNKYLVVIQHPVTTEYGKNLKNIEETIEAIDKLCIPTVWIWPNMDAGSNAISKGIRVYRESIKPKHVCFIKSLSIEFYAPLLNNSACIIGNSSSGIREAGYLGVPSVNIGSRQHGRSHCKNVINVESMSKNIINAVRHQLQHGKYEECYMYGNGNASEKIIRALVGNINMKLQKINSY